MWKSSQTDDVAPKPPTPVGAERRTSTTRTKNPGRRFGQIIKLKRERAEEYKACHVSVWPEVLKQIRDCNIEDYCIWYDEGTSILFGSFKYVGYDFAGDMERMAGNPKVREWWKMTDSYQESFVEGAVSSEAGEPLWWKPVEEVFYMP